jgi:hypothetical protein
LGAKRLLTTKSDLCLPPASRREVGRGEMVILILWLACLPKEGALAPSSGGESDARLHSQFLVQNLQGEDCP